MVEPGPLEFYAGEIFIGDLVINPTGTVENGGDLGTIVEDPIPPFTPTCTMPTQTIAPAGSILARAQLGNGRLVGEIGTDVVSAQISKSPLLINDWVVEGEYYQIGSYMSLDTHGSVLNIQISPKTAGQKVVITGVGLKSAAFSTAKEGFRYIVRANPTAAYVDASDYFVWDKGCPDDGQLKQVYLSSPGSETPWDMPYVSLSLMNPTSSGRWHLSDLEVYGYAVDAPVWTTATTGETLPTTEAAATTAAPPPAETTAPVDPATPTEVIPTGPSTTENPCQTPTTLPSLTWPATYPVLISWPGQNNMTAIVNYYDKTVNHAYTFDDVLSMNSTADWYASTIVTGSAGTGGGMKFEFETNATFRVAAVRLVHTKNLAAAAGTQLEFFAYQGSTVYKLGNYTYLVGLQKKVGTNPN